MSWTILSASPIVGESKRLLPWPSRPRTVTTAEDLSRDYLSRILRHVSCRVESREDAEDITAEVFAAAITSLATVSLRSDPYCWLLGIARRKIADHHRRRSRRRESDSLPNEAVWDSGVPPQDPARHEAIATIRDIVRALRDDQREALLLQYVDELAIGDIALVMRRSPASVNSLLQRARANVYRAGKAYFLDGEVNP